MLKLALSTLFSAALLPTPLSTATAETDSLSSQVTAENNDSVKIESKKTVADTKTATGAKRILTDTDFDEVAQRLGVEVAAIKAVVEIETGATHRGFAASGKPLVNFDISLFRIFASKRGINIDDYTESHPIVFEPTRNSQIRAHRRLESAKTINRQVAMECTFWGMFQIGGFNWKRCGAKSLDDFVDRISESERAQLELFADFITNVGLLKYLREKDWTKFARGYNGPGYTRYSYDTRMAKAYAKYSKTQTAEVATSSSPDSTETSVTATLKN